MGISLRQPRSNGSGAIRARLWLAQGKLDDARRWAEARGLSAEGKFDLENEVEYLTLVRLLLAEGRVDEAQRLLARLQSAVESTGRHGKPDRSPCPAGDCT